MEHQVKGGVHLFSYPEYDVHVRVDRINSSRNYINGHLAVRVGERGVFNSNVKLNDARDKELVVRRCHERYQEITDNVWDIIVEEVCLHVDKHAYAGSPPVILADIEISDKDMDWETYDEEWAMRLHHICTGMGFESIPRNITYRSQASSLADSGDVVHELIAECQTDLLIVDSLMGALQGQLVESGPASIFFDTLRSFDIPSLIVHHVNAEGGAYGGVYLHNYVRLKWNLKATPYANGKTLDLVAKAEKANSDSRGQELKWRVEFNVATNRKYTPGDSVTFERIMQNSGESTSGSPQEAIWRALEAGPELRDNLMIETGLYEKEFNHYVMDMLAKKRLVEQPGEYLARNVS
jgi:hypothetical protein